MMSKSLGESSLTLARDLVGEGVVLGGLPALFGYLFFRGGIHHRLGLLRRLRRRFGFLRRIFGSGFGHGFLVILFGEYLFGYAGGQLVIVYVGGNYLYGPWPRPVRLSRPEV